ncbi:MAG: lipoyl(octanoyl) transferase [Candidatus Westeberhardia cardiocondylae]|nr:lipoyl(octanoyl) transferase [Candidatus Westeberhardia cardiocondylae]
MDKFILLNTIIIRYLGIQPYEKILNSMNFFVNNRTFSDIDEIWLVQHHKVFTLGKFKKYEFITKNINIPIVVSNRGGDITYHGPGQQIMYILIDLHRRMIKIREVIHLLENLVISTLSHFSIKSYSIYHAPGVYVHGKKICSLGLRVNKGFLSHGLSLNIMMDLTPFSYINPCGYPGLRMTQMSNHSDVIESNEVIPVLLSNFCYFFKINNSIVKLWDENKYKK